MLVNMVDQSLVSQNRFEAVVKAGLAMTAGADVRQCIRYTDRGGAVWFPQERGGFRGDAGLLRNGHPIAPECGAGTVPCAQCLVVHGGTQALRKDH